MLQKNLNKTTRYGLVAVLILLLIAVRAFEEQLFYDPFLSYFKSDYLNLSFPEYRFWPLLGSMLLRYALNSVLSLAIIYVFFSDKALLRMTIILYVVLGLLLFATMFGLLLFSDSENNFILFYVRRLMIQPLFLMLFLPAFYFQQIKQVS
jgi:exosortase F-associated protein